jgi:hypothetical protein
LSREKVTNLLKIVFFSQAHHLQFDTDLTFDNLFLLVVFGAIVPGASFKLVGSCLISKAQFCFKVDAVFAPCEDIAAKRDYTLSEGVSFACEISGTSFDVTSVSELRLFDGSFVTTCDVQL